MSSESFSLHSLTCASSQEALKRVFEIEEAEQHEVNHRVLPNEKLSIIIPSEHDAKLVKATWGISIKGEPIVCKIGAKQALSKRPYSLLIRRSRCIVPVNCLVYTHAQNDPKLIRVLGQRIIGLGGLYTETKSFGGSKYEVCLFETTAPDILKTMFKTIPTMFDAEKARKWIGPSTLEEVFYRSERTNAYWFDYFSISEQFVNVQHPKGDLLKPIGLSNSDQRIRAEKIREIEIGKIRQNRSGK